MSRKERFINEIGPGLKKPVRIVTFTVGGIGIQVQRGADDTTPDNVVWFGGVAVNVDTGETVKEEHV